MTSYTTQNSLLLNNLIKFYEEDDNLEVMLNIINGESPYGSNINVPADKYYRETFFVSVHTRNLAKPIAISEKTGTSIGQTSSYNK